jgi:hypothetical protein
LHNKKSTFYRYLILYHIKITIASVFFVFVRFVFVESSMMGDSFLEKIWCSTEITNLRKKEEP